MTRVKPLFGYAGGKAKLLEIYAPFFQGLRPEYCVDYFGGSGTMSLWFHCLYPEAKLYLNEKDLAIYKLFKCLQDEYEAFCKEVRRIAEHYKRWCGAEKAFYDLLRQEYNRRRYGRYRTEDGRTEEERRDAEAEMLTEFLGIAREDIPQFQADFAGYDSTTAAEFEDQFGMHTPFEHACYFFLLRMCLFGLNQPDCRGRFTTEYSPAPHRRFYDPARVATFKAMLDHTALFNSDYRALDCPFPHALHYFDPPYVKAKTKLYTSHFSWDETAELCEYAQRLAEQSTVFMSNYDDPQLRKWMKGFDWYTFPTQGSLQARGKEPRREILFYKIHPSIAG
jgi:site-specific DNA-adenine methylase